MPVPVILLEDCLAGEDWPGRNAAHCIYSIGLSTLIDPNLTDLDDVNKPVGWRFIAGGHPSLPTAAACYAPDEKSGFKAKIACAMRTAGLAELLACAAALNGLEEVEKNPSSHYHLRVIRIPALYLEAFWLKSQRAGTPDLIVPYGLILADSNSIKLGAGATLRRNQAIPVDKFLKTIRAAAVARLARAKEAARARQSKASSAANRISSPLTAKKAAYAAQRKGPPKK